MKLDYKIIWVEDRIDTPPFKSLIGEVQTHLKAEFFNVILHTAEDFDEFKHKYESADTFDLIITDLNLNESHGNEVIDFVRDEKHVLTEIFFYSANSELSDTNLINNSRITFHQLDGADSYRELGASIIELINLTISKFQNIVTMRGMIMHETSSIDVRIGNLVKQQLKNSELAESIQPVIEQILDNILANATEKYKKSQSRKLKDILKDNVLFNASQKASALGQILELLKEEDFTGRYIDEIIAVRNSFAHAELKKDENGKEYFKVRGEDVIFDKEFCRDIRKKIIEHVENIDKLNLKLSN